MLKLLSVILTPAIGLIARGKSAKAIAGGAAGAITSVLVSNDIVGQVINAFTGGVGEALVPQAHDLGFAVAQAIAGYIVGHVITWFAPANKPA